MRPLEDRQIRLFADAGLAIAAIIWGGNFVLVKFAVTTMPPLYYVGTRFAVGAVILGLVAVPALRRLDRRQWLMSAGLGVVLFCGFWLQTEGLRHTTPALSGFLTSVYMLLVPLFIGVWTGRWPSWLVAAGILLVMAGLGVLMIYGEVDFGWGEVLTLVATLFWAAHILGVAYVSRRVGAIAMTEVQLAVCAALSLAVSLPWERPALFPGWGPVGAVVFTGIMGGIVAYILVALGQRHTPPTLSGVLLGLEAVFALLVSIAVGYDQITLRSLLGFALVFAGTTITRIGSGEQEESVSSEPAAPPL